MALRPRILLGAARARACLGAGPPRRPPRPSVLRPPYYAHYHEGLRTASGERSTCMR
jgi:hypothetical protein